MSSIITATPSYVNYHLLYKIYIMPSQFTWTIFMFNILKFLLGSLTCYNTLMNKIMSFFREVRAEFKNITWPKKDTLIQLTIVVISISVIISLILGGFDYIFTNGLNYIGTKQVPQINTNIIPTETASPSVTIIPTIKVINKK